MRTQFCKFTGAIKLHCIILLTAPDTSMRGGGEGGGIKKVAIPEGGLHELNDRQAEYDCRSLHEDEEELQEPLCRPPQESQ